MTLMAMALLLSGCGLVGDAVGVGSGRDAAEHFDVASARELAQAISRGSTSTIRDLVEGGASLGTTGKDGVTLMQWAVYENRHDALETLLELGADIEQAGIGGATVLHTAAIVDSSRHLRTLLDAGADPDLRRAVTERTPLMGAVGLRTDEHFWMLLEAGADVRLADRMGLTALHLAAMLNAGSHVLALLERGADPEAESSNGATFQNFFWTTNANIMNDRALSERQAVAEWLMAHDVAVHEDARWTKDQR